MLTLIRSRRRRNVSKFAGNNFLKKQPLTTILSDGVPVHKRFGAPSDEGYCKSEVFEVILVETPGGMKGEYLFKMIPSGNISIEFRTKKFLRKEINSHLDGKRVDNPKTQRKLMS